MMGLVQRAAPRAWLNELWALARRSFLSCQGERDQVDPEQHLIKCSRGSFYL